MKKLPLLLYAAMLTLMSCPSDDDATSQRQDQIIGTWKYYMYTENGVEEQLELCETEETLIFSIDGAYLGSSYEEFSGECELEFTAQGTWSNSGNSNYTIIIGDEPITENITFEGNTFYFEDTYNDGTTTIVYRDVYIRQ